MSKDRMIHWERIPIAIAIYTGVWLLALSPWWEFWPGLLLNPYLLFLYFSLIALVAWRLWDDFCIIAENKKLRWLFLARRVEGPLSTRMERIPLEKPLDTSIREQRSDGIRDGSQPGN